MTRESDPLLQSDTYPFLPSLCRLSTWHARYHTRIARQRSTRLPCQRAVRYQGHLALWPIANKNHPHRICSNSPICTCLPSSLSVQAFWLPSCKVLTPNIYQWKPVFKSQIWAQIWDFETNLRSPTDNHDLRFIGGDISKGPNLRFEPKSEIWVLVNIGCQAGGW